MMKRRYIICLQNLTQKHNDALREFFKSNGLGWWHWVGDTWFLTDPSGKFTAQLIRDNVRKMVPNERFIVIEINENGDTWSGVTTNDPDKKMFSWIRRVWKK